MNLIRGLFYLSYCNKRFIIRNIICDNKVETCVVGGVLSILTHYNFACVPSQNGLFPLWRQPHQATVVGSGICTVIGVCPDPLCVPSQKAPLLLFPHAHHV